MCDAQDEDQDLAFVDLVDHPVNTDPDAAQTREVALEQFADLRVFGEPIDGCHDAQTLRRSSSALKLF